MTIETKVQIEALKLLKKGKNIRYAESPDGKKIYITPDGFWGICIDEDEFWLDKEKLKLTPALLEIFSCEKLSKTSELKISDTLRRFGNNKIGDILSCNSFNTCIDSKFSKLLHKDDCEIYALNEKSAIYFVLDGEIYAVIMPMITHSENRR